jgi:hypothetical protein
MSDIMETEPTVKFEHYVAATREIVEEFRDELSKHTAKLQQDAIALGGHACDPQEAAELHRLRIGCDNFLNVLAGNY